MEIGDSVEIVVDLPIQVRRERVHGEIAPRRVLAPIVGEGDGRVAAEGLDVAAQRRHLDAGVIGDHGHRAVVDAGRNVLQPGGFGGLHHRRRFQRCRDIDVADLAPEQAVAHAAADETRRAAGALQRLIDGMRGTGRHPGLRKGAEIDLHRHAPVSTRRTSARLLSIPAVAPQM